MGELPLFQFSNTFLHILRKNEIQKRLQLVIIVREDMEPSCLNAHLPRDWCEGEGDISENIEQIAFLRINHAFNFGKLLIAIPLLR